MSVVLSPQKRPGLPGMSVKMFGMPDGSCLDQGILGNEG
jgi:hypothetical protein